MVIDCFSEEREERLRLQVEVLQAALLGTQNRVHDLQTGLNAITAMADQEGEGIEAADKIRWMKALALVALRAE